MKTLIFILLICLSFSGFAQVATAGKLVKYPTISQVNAAFSTKAKGDSLKLVLDSVKVDLTGKANTADIVDASWYSDIYIDSIKNRLDRGRFDNAIKRLTDLDIIRPIGGTNGLTGSANLTDGWNVLTLYEVIDTITVDRFQYILSTQGNYYSKTNYEGISLNSYDPTTKTYTKILETAIDTAIWSQPAGVLQTKTFTPTVLTPGFYAIGILYNTATTATTAPALQTYGNVVGAQNQLYGHYLSGYIQNSTAFGTTKVYADFTAPASYIPGIILR